MEGRYRQLSDDVIVSKEELYFARVCSAETLTRKLYEDEAEYGMWFKDIEITLKEEGHFTNAILTTLSKEEDGRMQYIKIINSDVLGMFISDWR